MSKISVEFNGVTYIVREPTIKDRNDCDVNMVLKHKKEVLDLMLYDYRMQELIRICLEKVGDEAITPANRDVLFQKIPVTTLTEIQLRTTEYFLEANLGSAKTELLI